MSRAFTIFVGALAGSLSGLLGIGGGLVVGPALALRGAPLAHALGTALCVVAPVACIGVVAELFSSPDNLHWLAAFGVALGGQVGAPVGARVVVKLPERGLRLLFCAFLVYVGLRNLGFFPSEDGGDGLRRIYEAPASELAIVSLSFVLGIGAGLCASLFGVGGGVVVVPGLLYVVGGFDFHSAAGTSLLAMIPTALRGAWIADRQGRVDRAQAKQLAPAALLAAAGAVVLRNRAFDHAFLTQIFGAFLLVVAVRLAFTKR